LGEHQKTPLIVVWDPFVRVFHWSIVAVVVSNLWVNEAGGRWHARLGYAAAALVVLRALWGWVAPNPYGRFSAFWPTPSLVRADFLAIVRREPRRHLSHPPLAALMMLVLCGLICALAFSGWMMSWDRFFGEDWLETLYEGLANMLLGFAALHALAAIAESARLRENLVAAMIHGRKRRE